MLIVLAWRNIWRNKKRSLIILASISFGLWGGFFSGAVMMGMGESVIESAIERNLSHIQLHQPEFQKDNEIKYTIPNGEEMINQIKKIDGVVAVSGRTIITGMAASPTSNAGVTIVGIIPEDAAQTTDIARKIISGSYFQDKYRYPIVVGHKMATKLNLKLKSKIILSFQGPDGNIIYHACRIVGIYKTESDTFDGMHVFVPQSELFKVLKSPPIIHEIAVRIQNTKNMAIMKKSLQSLYPHLSVQTWKEIAPEIAFLANAVESFSYLFVAIILLALLFGIINTMLMSVMDRIREFGMLMAVGLRKRRVFGLILLETVFLSVTGSIGGIVASLISVSFFNSYGIDLSYFSESLASFGMNTMLYPYLPPTMYVTIAVMIIIVANIAGLFPAIKAIRINPSESLRVY